MDWTAENSVSFQWDPPLKGLPILRYVVEKRVCQDKDWQQVDDHVRDTNCKVSELTTGTMYQLRVAAVNDVGTGPFAELQDHVTTIMQYGKLQYWWINHVMIAW